jgi:hypothetical protein
VVTQIVGIIAGYKWGFAGKNSKDAYKSTLGFSTFDDYTRYFNPILNAAEAKLSTLQQRLAERNANIGLGLKNTFENFLLERHVSHAEHRQATLDTPAPLARAATPIVVPQAAPAPELGIRPAPLSVSDVVAKVEQFGADKEGAKHFLLGLNDELRIAVTSVLKARKEARLRDEEDARAAQRNAALGQELDDIL